MVEKVNQCGDCRFLMQSETCLVCGHSQANTKPNGNGCYVYPPSGWSCDIGKFEKRVLPFKEEMKKTANDYGWVLVNSIHDGEVDHYTKKQYKPKNNSHGKKIN